MRKSVPEMWLLMGLLWLGGAMAATPDAGGTVLQGGVNPGYHDKPEWFKNSFMDLNEDVAEARAAGRRVLLYFYQDGCPYCEKLLRENFGDAAIAAKTQRLYDVIAINLWGDREVTGMDGAGVTEKQFAERLKVMYTPTLLFLDDAGAPLLRLNGYYAPERFDIALDYGARRETDDLSFRDYAARRAGARPVSQLQANPLFLAPPHALARNRVAAQRPLLVLFEQADCAACAEFHREILARPESRALLQRFDAVQLDMWSDATLVRPDGKRSSAAEWARQLNIQYTPSLVFFDEQGKEVFRTEAYLRTFHIQSVMEYIASGAYRRQPNLQRYIQERADHLREQGVAVDLME
ncbi:MAG: thioredoxin fold domain-containing protein [Spongiibacteraceae bacterium]|jgi:thioredoxin-related protein|nr:thioredoxin fold domain-containing protein [Spongiibacteraceae bacterium]